ncbi:MAG: hypothetical protein JWQ19_966 [Subtercola sp.]|nr:hypothetical protein [Subtercola sp.]
MPAPASGKYSRFRQVDSGCEWVGKTVALAGASVGLVLAGVMVTEERPGSAEQGGG